MGALGRQGEKNTASAAEEGQAGAESSTKPQFKSGWTGFGQRGDGARRKSVAQQQQDEDDDMKIRFTIGGVGRRMTKEDFIREVQMLDTGTRNEVVDHSNASNALKSIARQEPSTKPMPTPPSQPRVPVILEHGIESNGSGSGSGSSSNGESSRAAEKRSVSISPTRKQQPIPAEPPRGRRDRQSGDQVETAVERRRRLAVLASQTEDDGKDNDDTGETPAERRRRQAALGMGGPAAEEDSDTEDEGTERVPPARKGIRFAEPQRKG